MQTPIASRFATSLLALAFAALAATPAFAHKAHVHGVAKLEVVVDGESLQLRLESPLDNLLGFERAPRNDRERAAARDMANKLRQGERLFAPTAGAQCRLVSVSLHAPVLDATLLGEPGGNTKTPAKHDHKHDPKHEHGHDDHDDHADLVAEYRFQCARAGALTGMEVRLADQFKGLRRIDAQVVTPKRQSASRITARMRALSW